MRWMPRRPPSARYISSVRTRAETGHAIRTARGARRRARPVHHVARCPSRPPRTVRGDLLARRWMPRHPPSARHISSLGARGHAVKRRGRSMRRDASTVRWGPKVSTDARTACSGLRAARHAVQMSSSSRAAALRTVTTRDGLARLRDLRDAGHSRRTIDGLRADGALITAGRGWVALPGADPYLVAAARAGIVLTCVTAAARRGLWMPEGIATPHVGAPAHSSRAAGLPARVHWTAPLVPGIRHRLLTPSRTCCRSWRPVSLMNMRSLSGNPHSTRSSPTSISSAASPGGPLRGGYSPTRSRGPMPGSRPMWSRGCGGCAYRSVGRPGSTVTASTS